MKRFALLLTLASALLGLAACDRTPDAADATLPPPPTAATEALLLPTPISGATALATSIFATVAVATATESALATVAATATAEPPTDEPPTDEPPTNEPPTDESATVTATAETTAAVASPTAAAGTLFAPGQVDGATLAAGAAVSYQVQGQRFAPVILFVEPENNLDVALAAYSGDLSGQTTPEVTALAAADNALAGRPEILVLSPESDGLFTFVIRAASGEGFCQLRGEVHMGVLFDAVAQSAQPPHGMAGVAGRVGVEVRGGAEQTHNGQGLALHLLFRV